MLCVIMQSCLKIGMKAPCIVTLIRGKYARDARDAVRKMRAAQ